MTEEWLDEVDAEGESPRSRLLKAANAAGTLLLGMLLEEPPEEEPAIHQACRAGDVRQVRLLLEAGADPDERNQDSLAPLHWSALSGNLDLAKLLINRGAEINPVDTQLTGMTPWAMANLIGYKHISDYLAQFGANY